MNFKLDRTFVETFFFIVLVLAAVFSGIYLISAPKKPEGYCIENYVFVVSSGGHTQQIFDEHGRGVRCEGKGEPE